MALDNSRSFAAELLYSNDLAERSHDLQNHRSGFQGIKSCKAESGLQ
jgi:hypothetical protein